MIKVCKICKIEKDMIEFNICGKYKDKVYYRGECKECNLTLQKSESGKLAQQKYRNSEKGRLNKKRHKKTEKYLAWQREYDNKRIRIDFLYKVKKSLRDRLNKALKAKKWRKTTTFNQYIGCSLEDAKYHIEKQFQEGMTWENHGEWHIDHIVPLSLAKTEEELYKLCHYTNLQPLWAIDNLKKSNK